MYPYFLWFENNKTFEKEFWKEKKKQYCLDYKRAWKNFIPVTNIYASNIASIACKDLSHISYINYNNKDHYAIKCLKPKKDSDAKD